MIDIDALLEPISAESPCGEDMSFSIEFDAIQEARRSDDATLDQGEWVTDIKTADWPAVVDRCSELLATRSKDLRLAVWMAEACVHTDGFAGMAAGYRLVAELCERFWDDLHPVIEDIEEQELRVGNLRWLLAQSASWIRAIPLTDAPEGHFTAIDLEMAARGHGGDESSDYPDQTRVDVARSNTPFDFYQRLAEEVPQAKAMLKHFESVLDTRLGMDGPSFSATRDALEEVSGVALRLVEAAGVSSAGTAAADGDSAKTAAEGAPAAAAHANGEITTRREALLQLKRVAEFFRRTEPHSPVAYLAERAARWGNMPLHVWLKSVIKDDASLEHLQELLDVEATSADSED